MKSLQTLCAALVLFAAPARAGDWWFMGQVGKVDHRVVYFADADVNAVGGYQHLWVQRVLEQKGKLGERVVTSLFIFDCAQRRTSEVQQLFAGDEGEEITSPPFVPDWMFVPPSSMGGDLMRFACKAERPSGGKVGSQSTRAAAQERVFSRR